MKSIALAALALGLGCQREPAEEHRPPAPGGGETQSTPAPPPPGPNPSPAPPAEASRPAAPPLPDPLPGTRRDVSAFVGTAYRAAIGDLDGDGTREIVLVDPAQLRVVDRAGRAIASIAAPSGANIVTTLDVDGDHRAEIVVGWGMNREHKDAPAKVVLYRLAKDRLVEETIFSPETTRAEIVAILPWETNAIMVAYWESKYLVRSVVLRKGDSGWAPTQIASLRTATTYVRGDLDGDGAPDLVVGRVYGDAKGVDGDAFVLAPDGKRVPIPTLRGVRSLPIADGDLFIGDGWHQNYSQSAHGRLAWVRHTSAGFQAELVEDTAGQYAIERIVPAKIDGRTALVTQGSQYVRVFTRTDHGWQGLSIAGPARDIAIGDLDGVTGDEILVLGEPSVVVGLDQTSRR